MIRISPIRGIALVTLGAAVAGGCTPAFFDSEKPSTPSRKHPSVAKLQDQSGLDNQRIAEESLRLAEMQRQHDAQIAALKAQIGELQQQVAQSTSATEISSLRTRMAELQREVRDNETRTERELAVLRQKIADMRLSVEALETKLVNKLSTGAVAQTNISIMKSLNGHTQIYQLKGRYNTLVIPVEFAAEPRFDGLFKDRSRFLSGKAQKDLFGNGPDSMHTYYQHASGGLFDVAGEVVEPVRVDRPLTFYGKAVQGAKDEHAKELVVDALKKVKERVGDNPSWWKQFDRWDLNDLDSDGVYSEADGFLDAVVLVYAGKEQAGCQGAFDPKNQQPGSDDVPTDDPRHDAAVECFNRIWPHRSAVFLSKEDPDYPTRGPIVEGEDRGAMGFAITPNTYAFDYNMQSEYSDVSTFIHEFGHSLTLPDVYALQGDNNVGAWDIMASNARNSAQEQSSFHRIALGWLSPKIIEEGESFSAYLGSTNFTSPTQRESLPSFTGPLFSLQTLNRFQHAFSVVSEVPENSEPVYRSLLVRLKPSVKQIQEVELPTSSGQKTAYSGRFDGASRKMKFKVAVPTEGDATLAFDTIYFIETETNFGAPENDIRVVTDYDLGSLSLDGAKKDEFRTISGDNNYDTLNESNNACEVTRVLELRGKLIAKTATPDEKKEFKDKLTVCQAPTWVTKSYDLSAFRGKSVAVEIAYTTDAGYNEFGMFVDNIRVGTTTVYDFENSTIPGTEWVVSTNGQREATSNQLYVLEYRDPLESFGASGAYNMDQNIQGAQGMSAFLPNDGTLSPRERFRLITLQHQPGVLAWLLDTSFNRRENTPEDPAHLGRGYYLPLNNELRELTYPGVYDNPAFKDDTGFYDLNKQALQDAIKTAGAEYKCFGYSKLAAYLDGKAPACDGYPDLDGLGKLSLGGRKLVQSTDSYNNYLPFEQRTQFAVGNPFRMIRAASGFRGSFQTFRPADAGDFAPLKVWKADADGNMIIDDELTASALRMKPMSRFEDTSSLGNAAHLKDPRFAANRATVPSRGFSFDVVSPDADVLARYTSANPDDNSSIFRRPRVKVILRWDSAKIQDEWR